MMIEALNIRRFRSLADLTVDLHPINVLLGPNGTGKSSFLDSLWFLRDCAIRGVEEASAARDHGIGVLWDGAEPGETIAVSIETESAVYDAQFALTSGRIDPFLGESLISKVTDREWIQRPPGSGNATFFHSDLNQPLNVELREPTKLALTRFLDFAPTPPKEAREIDSALRFLNNYRSRDLDIWNLRHRGSEASHHEHLWDRAQNLWSVLRNLDGQRHRDDRLGTILEFMRRAFPKFDQLLFSAPAGNVVIAEFLEKKRRNPIKASGISDGVLCLLIHLTALFSPGSKPSILLFDEPEASLHPHAIAVLGEAVREATRSWNKQVLMATHSPVLVSQFDEEDVLITQPGEHGEALFRRATEIPDLQDLLEDYALGSLYMAEAVARQSVDEQVTA